MLVTFSSVAPCTKARLARYSHCPDSATAARASGPSSVARRSPSALTRPWALKRTAPSGCEPPSRATSPPNSRAVVPTSAKPRWLKSTRPRESASSGVSAVIRRSLPCSVSAPLMVVSWWCASGSASVNCRSAAPVAVLTSSDLDSQPPTGVTRTKRSISATGPCAAASSVNTASPPRLRTLAWTGSHRTLSSVACPLCSSSVPRSSARSTLAPVTAGHGESNAGAPASAGALGT